MKKRKKTKRVKLLKENFPKSCPLSSPIGKSHFALRKMNKNYVNHDTSW
jgi:hypothetical protein